MGDYKPLSTDIRTREEHNLIAPASQYTVVLMSLLLLLLFIVLIWDKEELPQEWKRSIIVPIHKKSNQMDCNNYRGILLLSTLYKILSNILLSRMPPFAN